MGVVCYVSEMPYLVRLHVYSGRSDPIWALTDADAERFLADWDGSEAGTSTLEPGLGYRGFSLSSSAVGSDERPAGGESDAASQAFEIFASGAPEIEERLLATGRDVIDDEVAAHVRERLQSGLPRLARASQAVPVACPPCRGAAAPQYRPAVWSPTRMRNNCYNYANDQITNTFAQPGRGSGRRFATLQCNDLDGAARRDGLGQAQGWQGPTAGWYVALAVWPNQDYHWYRQDRNGCWSHKPGQASVTDLDNACKRIGDPRLADRGPYQTFCGYKVTDRNARIA